MKHGRTLTELAIELDRQRKVKKDYLLDTRNVKMDAMENFFQITLINDEQRANTILGVNDIAHRQIGSTLGIPAKYYDKMRAENPDLLSTNVNSWFNETPSVRMVRTLDGTARAFLSERYRRIDNYEIAEAVLPIIAQIPDARVASCEVTEQRIYLKVVNPRLETEVSPGDVVQSGILITNSEVGLGSMAIQPLIYRLVCSNGMVVNDAATRRYHIGRGNEANEDYTLYSDETLKADDKALMLKVQDTVKAVVDATRFEKVVQMMRDAKDAKITSSDIPKMVELAASDYGLTKKEGGGILDYLIRDEELSLYGLSNAVTRAAQDAESYDRSTDMESIAYNILGMSRENWNRLNSVA
ncbi:MAG: DUF932 domain-containing protein [Christensenellales bacterium]|jgi:hypothetical protein